MKCAWGRSGYSVSAQAALRVVVGVTIALTVIGLLFKFFSGA